MGLTAEQILRALALASRSSSLFGLFHSSLWKPSNPRGATQSPCLEKFCPAPISFIFSLSLPLPPSPLPLFFPPLSLSLSHTHTQHGLISLLYPRSHGALLVLRDSTYCNLLWNRMPHIYTTSQLETVSLECKSYPSSFIWIFIIVLAPGFYT